MPGLFCHMTILITGVVFPLIVSHEYQANPAARQINLTRNAAIHATAHCSTTIPNAHLEPSSLLNEETAATQGV